MEETKAENKISVRGRMIVGFATFWCLAITYMQRQAITVIVAQVVSINKLEPKLFYWTGDEKSVVLMSFYAGYCFTQIIGGMSAEKYGAKITLSISILTSSVLTLLTPLAFEKSPYFLVGLRVLSGAAQGVFFPCFSVIVANWFPPSFRSSAIGLIFPGTYFGTIVASIIPSGLAYFPELWKISFYLFGCFGCVWLVLWQIFMTDDPHDNRFITNAEKQLLRDTVERKQVTDLRAIPVKAMFTSSAFLGIFGSHFAAAWNLFLIATLTPSYIKDIYSIQVKDQVYITFLIPLVTWLGGTVLCLLGDYLMNRKGKDKLKVKKAFNAFALLPTGIFLMLSTLIPPSQFGFGILLVLFACFSSGIFISTSVANIGDVAPQYFGIISGIINTLGALSGLLGIQTSYLFVNETHNPREWQYVYTLMIVVSIIGSTCFQFLAKGTIQPWAVQKYETERTIDL